MKYGSLLLSALLATTLHGADASAVPAPFFSSIPSKHDTLPFAEIVKAVKPEAKTKARALWLDAGHLRWAAPAGTVRVRLLGSEQAGLSTATGKAAWGADQALLLLPAAEPALQDAKRFSHVRGTVWRIQDSDTTKLADLWRGQLLLVAEDAKGQVLEATGTQLAGALDARYGAAAAKLDYGVEATAEGTRFRLWAPTARSVNLCVYDTSKSAGKALIPLEREPASGSWVLQTKEDLRGKFYRYVVEVFVPGVGLVRNHVTDPYSLSLCTDSQRSAFIDLGAPLTQPKGWNEDQGPQTVKASTDLVLYELHVRDFSRDDDSVPAEHRGKYLAFTHADSAGMKHLRALGEAGVTDIHLLPTYDLASIPERDAVTPVLPVAGPDSPEVQAAVAPLRERDSFNWGYDPWHYAAPEGSYATDADAPAARVREFRAMVQALHNTGLRVGLDVVFNHTMASGQDRQSVLDRIVPGYYQRLNASGSVESSTCCSNTATENTMMAKLMIDAAVLWTRQYHVDSFRFDLMGHQPRAAMEQLQAAVDAAAGHHVHLIGEGWNFGEVENGARFVQASQLSLQHSGIGTFSDRMRDAARGGRAGDSKDELYAQGWLNGLHYAPNAHRVGKDTEAQLAAAADLLRVGLAGSLYDYVLEGSDGRSRSLGEFLYGDQPAGYAAEPGEVVNYVENHDNQTLFDNNVMRLPLETPAAERARVQVLGNALVLFSQGIAYLHAGQDILRSKSLDRNSFNSGDAFNRIDWTLHTNHFGVGLPLAEDNGASWPQMKPALALAAKIAPSPADLQFASAATQDLLKIRHSSTLFRLRTTADVKQRLHFLNTGVGARNTVLTAVLDGKGYEGAGFAKLLYVINADTTAQTLNLPDQAKRAWKLHPVQAAATAAEPRAKAAHFDAAAGTLTVPARTAVVFVLLE